MREKLLDLMKNEGLKSSQLADMLGVNPAGISHILAGRNKPGFDLLQKILRRFPRINPDWLLLDTGPMYRDAESTETIPPRIAETPIKVSEPTVAPAGDLFASRPTDRLTDRPTGPVSAASSISGPAASAGEAALPKSPNRSAAVRRVVIFYDDDSFEAYFPTAR